MKLKTKLPLLFLLMFALILVLLAELIQILVSNRGPERLGALLGPIHLQMLIFMAFVMAAMFLVLTLYVHRNVTKPIQTLNANLKNVRIGSPHQLSLQRRKDEIGELQFHFIQMLDRLQQANKEQVDMIAAIAHDVKTPLTTITGFLELLSMQQGLDESDKQEYYRLMMKKAKHIEELINGFSAFSRGELELQAGKMNPVNVKEWYDNIAAEYEQELAGLGYELEWRHSFGSGLRLNINELMIRRVFGNLFGNAVRYGERPDLKVYLSGYVRDPFVYVQFEDNGPGVPDSDIQSLFHKFFTVDKSRPSNNGGTGLGLANCRSIVMHHGGEIEAFHSKHGGLGIRFSLPLIPL